MKQNLPYYLALFFCLISSAVIAQQPTVEWEKRYSGMGSQDNFTTAMAVDAAGSVYVASNTRHSDFGEKEFSFVVVKYAPSGEKLWEKVYETDVTTSASSIAVDNTGGVFVTGRIGYWSNHYDYLTVRFNAATGAEEWVQTYNGESNGPDEAAAIAVDNKGGVYVTGYSSTIGPIGNIGDFATIRYDAVTGTQSWVKHYDGYNGEHDAATAIVTDNSGSVYVMGHSSGGGVHPPNATIRYDAATGTEVWVQRGGGFAAIAVDNQGGVYTTGGIRSDDESNYLTLRFDAATGAKTWERQYNGPGSNYDVATAIVVDNRGSVYVTGTGATVSYTAETGTQRWAQHHDFFATDITTDNLGGIYVTGYHSVSGQSDYVTIRYDAQSGAQSWVQRYDGPAHGYDQSWHIAVDGLGGLYVSGGSESLRTGKDIATIHYVAATGAQNWVARLDVKGHLADFPIAVAVDAAGNSYVTGSSNYYDFMNNVSRIVTIKYSPTGEELWVSSYEAGHNQRASSTGIAVDAAGNTYVTGNIYRSHFVETTTQMVTIKYAPSGEELWAEIYEAEPNSRAAAIAVDQSGGVYVLGTSYQVNFDWGYYRTTSSKFITIRYDEATGATRWASFHSTPAYSFNFASSMAVDNTGGVYVTGSSTDYTSNAFTTVRYDAATGVESWADHYNRADVSISVSDIAVDNNGGVFVTGSVYYGDGSDYTTIGYQASTGTQRWIQQYDGPTNGNDWATSIVADHSGSVFVTGASYGRNESNSGDFATIRYDAQSGNELWVRRFDGPNKHQDEAKAIAVDNQGGVYVTGVSYGDSYATSVFSTVKYATADGSPIWHIHTEGYRDGAVDLALDADHNVIVTGYSRTTLTDYDFLTIKYSQSGTCAPLAQAAIQGSSTAHTGARGVTYSVSVPGATSYEWRITDDHGEPHTGFTGQGTGAISVNWPEAPHAFKVSVTYSGGPGCPTREAVAYVHVFDVGAGFVTGGGWLHSPANPALELMQQPGRAYFDLMAKYKKGDEHLVQGETQLRIENSHMVFRSTHHEAQSLVINGNHAFYRGHGTLEHRGERGQPVRDPRSFAFLVSATDADFGPGNGRNKAPDLLRVMVWELNADGSRGALVYDNQTGALEASLDENAHAAQAIGGGNIVIHSLYLAQSKKNKLEAADAPAGLTAYPTVFDDRTTLSFDAEGSAAYNLELFDLKGSLVKRIAGGTAEAGQRYTYEVRAEGLDKGMYLARLTTGGSVQTVKIIVNR
jgi:outer membrane protein assembly factor BamB